MGDTILEPWYKNLEVSAAGGLNWLNTNNKTLTISPFETDQVIVNEVSNQAAWKVGVGYYFFEDLPFFRNFLQNLLVEANVYQVSGHLNGVVLQYELPQFTNYNFNAPFTSTRLMFDAKPNLFTYNRLSAYLLLGVGAAWNKLSYRELGIGVGVPPNSNLILSNNTNVQLAGDLGLGLDVVLSKHLNFTAEYVYGFMGQGSPGNNSPNGVLLQTAPKFSFQSQSLLFGLRLKA